MILFQRSFIGLGIACWAWTVAAQTNPADVFEKNVQPVLRANCLQCHNQQLKTSGLALDSRASVLGGGNRGPAAKPGAPSESLIIQAVEQKIGRTLDL